MSEGPKTPQQLQAELDQTRMELERSREENARLKGKAEQSQDAAFEERQRAHDERRRLMDLAVSTSGEADQARQEAHEDRTQLRGEVTSFKEDITEKLEQLTRHKFRGESFVETAPIGIAYLDRDLFYRWANPTFTALMNRPLEGIINHPLLEVFPQAKEQLVRLLNQVIQTGRASPDNKPVMLPFTPANSADASPKNWDLLVLPMVAGEKDEVEGVLVAIEVTERVATQRKQQEQIATLTQANLRKGETLEDASRKMRGPLASISGSAGSLQASLSGVTEEQRQYIGKIQGSEAELTRIVDDLLEMARIATGSYELHYEEADVSALVRDNIERLAEEARVLQVSPKVKLSDEPLIVKADRRRLDRVLQTLLGNAIRSTPPGGHMAVAVIAGEHEARVEIVDGGKGIDSEDVSRVFDQFSALNLSKPEEVARAGRGLAISKTLIELHGGTIWATCEEGQGTTFWFKLPLAPQAVKPESSTGLKVSMLDASPAKEKPPVQKRTRKNQAG